MAELPTGTITFLFSDIEGSTRLLQSLGDAFPRVLEDQQQVLRAAFDAHAGIEVGTEGDSFFVVFTSARDAVAAAAEAQHAIEAHAWPEGAAVHVRMGLHTGEGLLFGDNYGGIDVHKAARIAGAAHGGQVLLSATTASLVDGALPDSVSLRDLGEHRLKDLARAERLFQLCLQGLPTEFPPIKSLGGDRPTNLIQPLTTFVGRELEVHEILDLLQAARLVTLTGPGGTGKSRLSLAVAQAALDDFPDGVYFVPLAPIVDPAHVAPAIAREVGAKEEFDRSLEETLKAHLAGQSMLLVLDNFEQIMGAAGFVAELLQAAPDLKVIATSRGALRISGEHEFPVPPLSLPDPAHLPTVQDMMQIESVVLFVQRAAAVKPGFSVTDENAHAVAIICAALDGLPLAIELAAARVRVLDPGAIVKRLEKKLPLLTSGARDLPERQRTLRGAIDWSFDLLDEPEQVFFRRASAFYGTFSLAGLEEVCNPGLELGIDALDALESLIDKSLVRSEPALDGEARFRILHVIREYGLEKLDASGEALEIRRRHAAFYVRLAEEAEPNITMGGPLLARLEAEQDNFRAVMRHALEDDDPVAGWRVGGALWRFWHIRGHLLEGREWLERLLDAAPEERDTAAFAKASSALGSLFYWQEDYARARALYERSASLFEAVGDRAGVAEQLYSLGYIATIERDLDAAHDLYTRSRALYKEIGDRKGYAYATIGLGIRLSFAGETEEAKRYGAEADEYFAEAGDLWGRGLFYWLIYRHERAQGNWHGVVETLNAIMEILKDFADEATMADYVEFLAEALAALGQPRDAVKLTSYAATARARLGYGAPRVLLDMPDLLPGLREALPADEFDRAVAEGRALTREEGLAYVRAIASESTRSASMKAD